MKTKIFLAPLVLVLGLAPQVALADVQTLFETNAAGGHGFYNGNGGVDGMFTTTVADYGTNGAISLSLRGEIRFLGPITPTDNTDYACLAGQSCNFDWSVETSGGFKIGDFAYNLLVTDLTKGTSLSFDPTNLLLGDTYWNGGITSTFSTAATGFQNSEFFGFGFISTPLHYNQTDQILVTLSATPNNGALADPSVTIGFNTAAPVPEPSALVLGFTVVSLLGISRLWRRRQA